MYKKVQHIVVSSLLISGVITACNATNEKDDMLGQSSSSASIIPQPIPSGYHFPGDRTVIQAYADSFDHKKAREHAWDIWAGMTADSNSSYLGQTLPIWETWCGTAETFGNQDCISLVKPSRTFEKPKQHVHAAASEASTQVVSFNKFNPSMAKYIESSHAGPGGKTYDYWVKNSIVTLNNNWPATTPTANRKVAEAPYKPGSSSKQGDAAMELKPVFFLVKAGTKLTPVPFWQGPSVSTTPSTPTPTTWTTCVLFDPAKATYSKTFKLRAATSAEKQNIISQQTDLSCKDSDYQYSPMGQIYHFELDASSALAWNAAQGNQGLKAAAGDYAVLVAMHVNTKEIVNWTWQTFWWQSGQDTPAGEPGSGVGPSSNVKDQWANYAMCANYKQTKNAKGDMDICYNPYLETAFGVDGGLKSNCMSCHGQAIVGNKPGYPAKYDSPIKFNHGAYYENATSTDFSWALQGNNPGN